MNNMFDILLGRPLPPEVLHGLLFATFVLHMIFVLLTVGTAILAVFYLLRARSVTASTPAAGAAEGRDDMPGWLHRVMDAFLAHKSLAVVLGVAPLLLIQVGLTIPFFTSVNLFAPYWLGIILCLILSFLTLDYVGRKALQHRVLRLALAAAGLVLLLAVPAVFAAVLTAAENSGSWLDIVRSGYRFSGPLAWHWLARYAHVVAAGITFAGLFFTLVARREDAGRRRALLNWAVGGMLAQIVVGVALYVSLPARPDSLTNGVLAVGIALVLVLLALALRARATGRGLALGAVAPVGLALLIAMLLARQMLQDRAVTPLNDRLNANADTVRAALAPQRAAALTSYRLTLDTPYDNPHNVYTQSCSFCHGASAQGNGVEAGNLAVAPEMVAAVRTTQPYLRQRLLQGVPGSAMPYFTVYTGAQLDDLMSYLDGLYGTFDAPPAVTQPVSATADQQAAATFGSVCKTCHAADGSGNTPPALGLAPAPPDFRHFSLLPEQTFGVISNGYAGTAMAPYSNLSEEVRWALVKYVAGFRKD